MFFDKKPDQDFDPNYPHFPLNLRIGAILTVDEAERLRFEGLPLTWRLPEGEVLVEALSELALFGLRIVRAYARSGDTRLLFQFNFDKDGNHLDSNCFGLLEEIRPGTADEWGLWLDEGGLLGGTDLNAPNGQRYLRQWGDGDYTAPVEVEERIYSDPKSPPRLVSHRLTLYAREVGEENENLLVSADNETDDAMIRAWIGLDLTPVGITIY